ncbi:hypothetical protein BC830DRAFT_178502 [Chytriomyces sp. MP71]|nr:hypothetical protein BC830DRAFT_178502 [Chytriomyces sp. MP71]
MIITSLAVMPTLAAASFQAGGVQYSATPSENGTVIICMNGTVDTNTWIGFGIPLDNGMIGADLTIAWADGADQSVRWLHGVGGGRFEQPVFVQDNSATAVNETIVSNVAESVYEGGELLACFERPVIATSGSRGRNVPLGPKTFLWATGPVLDSIPLKHVNQGAIGGVSLLPAPSTTTTTTTLGASSTMAASVSVLATSKVSSGKSINFGSASVALTLHYFL